MEGTPLITVENDVAAETSDKPFEALVELAMRTCRVLDRAQGCSWYDKLCDDEIGVESDCPGQALRAYRRVALTDSEVDL